MEIIGKITRLLPMQSGTSQSGNEYKRQTIIIQYGDRYPKDLALTLMNDKCLTYSQHLQEGMQLKFFFDVSSREYNGRYYTECIIWKIESLTNQASAQQPYYQPPTAPIPSTRAPQPAPTHQEYQQAYQRPPMPSMPNVSEMPSYAPPIPSTSEPKDPLPF